MHKVLCSTGALITRKNGRDHRLLAGFAEQLHCDGFEFMLYDSWYDKLDSIADDVKAMGLDIPAVHCEKSIGELIAAEDDLAYERFEMNCKAAERVGAKLLAALPAHEEGAKAILIEAECPEAELMSYAIDLRSMTQSRGSFTFHFVRYEDCPPAAQQKAIEEAKALAEE